VLLARVYVDVPRETRTVLVTRLQSLGFVDHVLGLAFVLPVLPGLEGGAVLRFNGAVGEELVYFYQLAALLVVLLDFLQGGVDPRFHRPFDVQHTSVFTELDYHLL
jgi:hypothetical protein